MRSISLFLVCILCAGCATMSCAKEPSAKQKDPRLAALVAKLTPLQRRVTQEEGTEPPFRNAFWNNKRPGIYVDIVSGEPLFSSTHKFKSGTGWPSFTKPLVSTNVVEVKDRTLGMTRVEVRSKQADSHLGHVFADGPTAGGLRYCINSASMRFVPAGQLDAQGLGQYRGLFAGTKKAAPSTGQPAQSQPTKPCCTGQTGAASQPSVGEPKPAQGNPVPPR